MEKERMRGKILIVDDNEDVLLALNMLLRPHVDAVRVITEPERIEEMMQSFAPDVIILDMNFRRDAVSGEEGYTWLARIRQKDPKAVVLFITAYVDTEKAVRAIKAGAIDFIPKPWDRKKLLEIVESAVELRKVRTNPTISQPQISSEATADSFLLTTDFADFTELRKENKSVFSVQSVVERTQSAGFIASCSAMKQLLSQIEMVAPTDANILIMGENGTGKDVVAHLIHEQSKRSDKEFGGIDLGSLPESLFESELFGYEKGAFTGANAAKAGRIETADGGTLFLDEIGNLTPLMQQKLLTVIEKRQVSRLGSTKTKTVDVRIVSATNADLHQRVADGTFRQDLLYRINTIELHLPPLRQRGNDIMLLAEHFTRKMAAKYGKPVPELTEEVREKLLSHSWPGNVRELQHVIERFVVMGELPPLNPVRETAKAESTLNLAELEKQAIMKAVDMSNGNLTQAAEMLGITRFALYRKIEKLK